MKTIKELAEELNVSRQGLTKRIDALGFRESLIKTSGGLSIPDDVEVAIRNYFKPDETKSNETQQDETENNQNSKILKPNETKDNSMQQDETKSNHPKSIEVTKSNQKQPDYETICNQMKQYETECNQMKAEVTELNHRLDLSEQQNSSLLKEIEMLNQTIAELKADKADLQQHRDNLTSALTLSKSDLARLENIITQMAALPLGTRIFGWSGAVQRLTDMSAGEIGVQDQTQTVVVEVDATQQDIQSQE